MNFWQLITGNSSLPVQAGNTFWDHLNNQIGGGGTTIINHLENFSVELEQSPVSVVLQESSIEVELSETIISVEITEDAG